jgi:hypothetical protein
MKSSGQGAESRVIPLLASNFDSGNPVGVGYGARSWLRASMLNRYTHMERGLIFNIHAKSLYKIGIVSIQDACQPDTQSEHAKLI